MSRFIVRRLFYMFVTMMIATLLVFSLSRIVGDPRLLYVQEGGYGLSPEAWDALGVKLHLDKPVAVQYLYWLGDDFFEDAPKPRGVLQIPFRPPPIWPSILRFLHTFLHEGFQRQS